MGKDSLRGVTEPPTPSGPVAGTLDDVLGFDFLHADEESVQGRFTVEDRVRQPFGIVHGGAYAAFGETLASMATYLAVKDGGDIAVGQSNQTHFLRPVSEGTISAEGRRVHRGRTTWVWDIDFTDEQGRLCATTRVTMAVRPRPS
jgi:1,4-dihydroxy-2-naphthoyl-CoA hydrolase